MNSLRHLSVGTRLWLAVTFIVVALIATIATAGSRSARLTAESERALSELSRKTAIAIEWAGLTETSMTRVQASMLSGDPVVEELYRDITPKGIARISALQEQLGRMPLNDAEKAQLQVIGEQRQRVHASLGKATELKKAGDAAGAAQEIVNRFNALVPPYLQALRDFALLQEKLLTEAQAEQAEMRVTSLKLAGINVLALIVGIVVGAHFLIRSIRAPLNATVAFAQQMADGDLTARIDTGRRDEFGTMLMALEHMRDRLRSVVADVQQGTENINVAAREIATGNQDLSTRTEQTASSLQETAASMEQMSGTIRQSADSARAANQLADVAGQSAARGGEVRSLAQRSAQAAREIKDLIGTSVGKVAEGSELVGQAGQAMSEIVDSVSRVRHIIGDIAAASTEQADGVNQINVAVASLDRMTQQNAALVEQSAAAASSMTEQAGRLSAAVRVFRLGHEAGTAAHA